MKAQPIYNTAEIWNRRYQDTQHGLSAPRSFLMENLSFLPVRGWALDVAMGLGHNAKILSDHGLTVVGVDFSFVALKAAKKSFPQLNLLLVNLPDFHFLSESFDVILNFWFLERHLFPVLKTLMKPGGILFFETMRSDPEINTQDINPDYLLRPGELKEKFSDWTMLLYDESLTTNVRNSPQPVVRMLARKPLN